MDQRDSNSEGGLYVNFLSVYMPIFTTSEFYLQKHRRKGISLEACL